MNKLIFVILIVSGIVASITYAVGRLFKNTRIAKYIPGALILLLSLYYYYMSRQPSIGFEDLAQFISAILLFAGGVGGIATAFAMDYAKSKKK